MNSVQCEVAHFIAVHTTKAGGQSFRLKNGGKTKITLDVKTTFKGGVSYTKVDVKDSSLLSLFLIAGTEGIDYPKASLEGTGTNSAQLVFTMRQSPRDALSAQERCFDPDDPTRIVDSIEVANSTNAFSYRSLGLRNWLEKFAQETEGEKSDVLGTSLTPSLESIKLTTQFELVISFSSSWKRLITIVPIANFPIGTIAPTRSHTLTVELEGVAK